MAENEIDFLKGNPKTVFFRNLVPGVMAMLAVALYSFVDTFVVGQAIGANAVAAMGVATPIVCLHFALGFLIGAGGSVRYSIARVSKQEEAAQKIYSLSVFLVMLIGISGIVLGNLFLYPIARFLGATASNEAMTVTYLRWIFSLSPFLIMDVAMGNFMRNDGHPSVSAIATITGTTINIILDFLFVMGFRWGMHGAASATCLASIISVAINMGYSRTEKCHLRLSFKKLPFHQWMQIPINGVGSFVLEGAIAVITFFFLNAVGKWKGDVGISAFTVVLTLNTVVYSIINGVAQTMQPLVSASHGVGDEARAYLFCRYAIVSGGAFGLLFFILSQACPAFLARCFLTDSPRALELAEKAIRLHGISFILMGISIQIGIFFQAKQRTGEAFLVLTSRSFLLPTAVLFLLQAVLGEAAVWIAIPIGEAFTLMIAFYLWKKDRLSSP